MYEFVRGPLMWLILTVFVMGMGVRVFELVRLSRARDQGFYDHFHWGWALRSIFHWILPLNETVRQYPVYSAVTYTFHILLLFVPVFVLAHVVLFYESFAIEWWTLPESATDVFAMVMVGCVAFLMIRRAVVPYVRIVNAPVDFLLLALIGLPFLTGLLARHQLLDYQTMLVLHILSGQLLIVLIPFTKLSHMVLFFLTRAAIGVEFGQRRGTRTW